MGDLTPGFSGADPTLNGESSGTNGLPQGVEKVKISPETNGKDAFGFRLSGSRTMGVYVTTVIGGTDIEKAGKLKTGDQLLQCDDVRLTGMTSDQVAKILRMAFAMHGYTELIVAKQWARAKGHSYRATSTPFKFSKSDHSIVTINSTDSTSRYSTVTQVEVHNENSEEPLNVESGMGRSITMEVMTGYAHDDLELHPNIPRDSPAQGRRSAEGRVGSTKTKKSSTGSRKSSSADVDRRKMFSPKKYAEVSPDQNQETTSDVNVDQMSPLSSPDEEDDTFHSTRSSRRSTPTTTTTTVGLWATAQGSIRRSFRVHKTPSDELPLVPMDNMEESPKTSGAQAGHSDDKRGRRSAESATSDESGRISNGNASDASNEFSWHCPVCLDGAKRIKGTKRRLMATQCGHVFCSKCLHSITRQHKLCPTCRSKVIPAETHPIFM